MKKFKYTATDKEGKVTKGTFLAESEAEMKEMLLKSGLYVTSSRALSSADFSTFFSLSGKVKVKDLSQFCNQFSVMIVSGVPIVESISLLKTQTQSGLLKKTLAKIEDDMKQGLLLSDAMKKYPKVFPPFFSSMVFVGENAGCLDQVLVTVAQYFETEDKTKRKVKGALAYPALLLVLTVAVVILMFVFIIPTFISSFSKMNVEMPPLTMAIFNMSQFFQEYWLYVLAFLAAFVIILWLLRFVPSFRFFLDHMKVTLPVFKRLNMARFTSRFARSLGLLLDNGADTLGALENIRQTIDNKYLLAQFDKVIVQVKMGASLSKALTAEMKLSPILLQMIAVGEKTGEMAAVLLKTAPYFDQDVENALAAMTAILQPAVLVLLGGVIAVLFVAMYSPILSMITSMDTTSA